MNTSLLFRFSSSSLPDLGLFVDHEHSLILSDRLPFETAASLIAGRDLVLADLKPGHILIFKNNRFRGRKDIRFWLLELGNVHL
jgi:hypothetical protein